MAAEFAYSPQAKSAIILLILLSVISITLLFKDTLASMPNRGKDPIAAYEERFSGLKSILPGQSIVGYITDLTQEQLAYNSSYIAEYFLTQYALAPIIVDNNSDHQLIIGNFHHQPLPAELSGKGLRVVKDLENGVMLLRREAP